MNSVWSMIKTRHDNNMIDHTGAVYAKIRTELLWPIIQVWSPQTIILNCEDQLNSVHYMMKTRQNNNVTDHTGSLYIENKIELSLLIQ